MLKNTLLILIVTVLIYGCKKREYVFVEAVVTTSIGDNTAPPDSTIPTVIKENYIHKAYITLLGRKPTTAEFNSGLAIININNLSQANRATFLNSLLVSDDYKNRLVDLFWNQLIENTDSSDIDQMQYIFNLLSTDSVYVDTWDVFENELLRLNALETVKADYSSGVIDLREVHEILISNYFYDQINMGSSNFCIATFLHFMNRYPTDSELLGATNMVDGFESIIFFEQGNSKQDFLDLFFQTNNYYEGLANSLYLRFLFRDGTPSELVNGVTLLSNDFNYEALQITILSTDEFVGI